MLKLTYFNGRGMAETSRLIMVIARQKFEDKRYPIKIIDWATHNMERKEFNDDQENGLLWKSNKKVPFLNIGEAVISQSKAIERYLARKFSLMGSSEEEAALIDSYCEYIRDFKNVYHCAKRKENRDESMDTWFNKTLPEKLKTFNDLITRNNDFQNLDTGDKEYAVGNKISLIDIVIFTFLTEFFDNTEAVNKAYLNCDMLQKIVKNINENDDVKAWISSRENTVF